MEYKEKILVTGCAGFIGFHLCRRLLQDGFEVHGLDNLNSYYDIQLKKSRLGLLLCSPNFKWYNNSLENKGFEHIFEGGFSRVIHLAAQAGVRYSLQNPHQYLESNITGFLNILEASRRYNVEHLLYASSSSVYGANDKVPFSVEDRTDQPVSFYAATKKTNEVMAYAYSHLYGLPTTGLRLFTVYGPWGRPDMAYFKFTKAILEGKAIDVFNYGNVKRDFTYIDDVIEAICRLIKLVPKMVKGKDVPWQIYNIGQSHPVQVSDMISILERELGRKAVRNLLPLQQGDVVETYADVTKLAADTGFTPCFSMDEGLRHFVQWYKTYYLEQKAYSLGNSVP